MSKSGRSTEAVHLLLVGLNVSDSSEIVSPIVPMQLFKGGGNDNQVLKILEVKIESDIFHHFYT